MKLDAGVVSSLLIATVTLLGWLVTKATARDKAFREELKWRRKQQGLKDRYIFRLETELNKRDIELPVKPQGMEDEMDEEWS